MPGKPTLTAHQVCRDFCTASAKDPPAHHAPICRGIEARDAAIRAEVWGEVRDAIARDPSRAVFELADRVRATAPTPASAPTVVELAPGVYTTDPPIRSAFIREPSEPTHIRNGEAASRAGESARVSAVPPPPLSEPPRSEVCGARLRSGHRSVAETCQEPRPCPVHVPPRRRDNAGLVEVVAQGILDVALREAKQGPAKVHQVVGEVGFRDRAIAALDAVDAFERTTGTVDEENTVDCETCGGPRDRCESRSSDGTRCNYPKGYRHDYHRGDASGWPSTPPVPTPDEPARVPVDVRDSVNDYCGPCYHRGHKHVTGPCLDPEPARVPTGTGETCGTCKGTKRVFSSYGFRGVDGLTAVRGQWEPCGDCRGTGREPSSKRTP